MNRLDKVALSVIFALLVALVTVAWIGNPVGLQVALIQEQGISPLGPLTLEFSQPVNVAALSGQLALEPQGIATVEAVSSRRVSLTPGRLIRPEEPATLRLNAGTYGANGESLENGQSWAVNVRQPEIVFRGTLSRPPELFRVALDGSQPVQLTQTGGRVYDFDVAPNGDQIVYSLVNEQGGSDLWQIGRTGQDNHRLLDCGMDRCTTPAFSPEGKRLAYTREAAGIAPGAPPGAPRPWVLDLVQGQNAPLYSDKQTIGYGPSWAPSGNRIASWDGVNGGIHMVDLQTGEETLLPTQSGGTGGWSPDGAQMLFTRYEPVGQSSQSLIYQADFTSGEVGLFLGGGESDSAYSAPTWSPDGVHIAINLKSSAESPMRSIWIIRPDILGGPTIGGEADTTYGSYQWDLSSSTLVFQRMHVGGNPLAEIAIYLLSTGEIQILAEGGGWPQWLP